jgi:hypothetical protein
MPRRVKLPTSEMGELQLLLLTGWEEPWACLRGTPFGDLLSTASREAVDHALHKLSRPLVDSLGIPPVGALRKVPEESRVCLLRRPGPNRKACPIQGSECHIEAPKMPWCFEPDGIGDEAVRRAAGLAIEQWRAGVYVVVVTEVENA